MIIPMKLTKTCTQCRSKPKLQCPHCESKFSQNGDLNRHINAIHLKQQNYKCGKCDYKC